MKEGFVPVEGGKVWYKVVGADHGIPLVVLHGGPGSAHDSLEILDVLGDERPVVFYDQLGSGNSERPEDRSLWHVDRFVQELGQLRAVLGLGEIHLLGHSWGTMLAASYLLTNPAGVRSIIFSSPCLSAPMWARDQARYLADMPAVLREVIVRSEADGTTDSQEYKDATEAYYKRHLCRLDPLPELMQQGKKKSNSEIYNIMWGPSEFCATGTLKDFDVTAELPGLQLPALFLCGQFDEATPETTGFYQSLVPGSQFHVFEDSAHSAYQEEPAEYERIVREFLRTVE